MKKSLVWFASFFLFLTLGWAQAQELKPIQLSKPDMTRGASLMAALSSKASVQGWSDKELSLQDLSDLLWAAAGINRPDNKKRTYSSAQNAQDVDVFVFLKAGVYVYDAAGNALNQVLSGDHRGDIAASFSMGGGTGPGGGRPEGAAGGPPAGSSSGGPSAAGSGGQANFPVDILLVSDSSKFRAGTQELKSEWGAVSAGIVTQNIMLFCAANGLGTHPRAMFDKAALRKMLNLKDSQNPILELPVGYPN